jgi:hypothetical protein
MGGQSVVLGVHAVEDRVATSAKFAETPRVAGVGTDAGHEFMLGTRSASRHHGDCVAFACQPRGDGAAGGSGSHD